MAAGASTKEETPSLHEPPCSSASTAHRHHDHLLHRHSWGSSNSHGELVDLVGVAESVIGDQDPSMATFQPRRVDAHQADYLTPAGSIYVPTSTVDDGNQQVELYGALQSGVALLGSGSDGAKKQAEQYDTSGFLWRCGYGPATDDPPPPAYQPHGHLLASSSRTNVPVGGMHHHQPVPWQLPSAGGSKYLKYAQELLQELCSLPAPDDISGSGKRRKKSDAADNESGGAATATVLTSSMDKCELQRLKARLSAMVEEVDRRYRLYREQLRALAASFDSAAGERSAAGYTALASRAMSLHFRAFRDRVVRQLRAVKEELGDEVDLSAQGSTKAETPRLRIVDQCVQRQKAMQYAGVVENEPWRPHRGLPERSVSVLRAWLFEHFLHPYPSDVDKHMLSRQTGLSRIQVSNWFINARVRLWKPMVEEMYREEMKDADEGRRSDENAVGLEHHAMEESFLRGEEERKPMRLHMHPPTSTHLHLLGADSGSLASVVNSTDGLRLQGSAVGDSFGHLTLGQHLDLMGAYGQLHCPGAGDDLLNHSGSVSLTLGLKQHSGGGVGVVGESRYQLYGDDEEQRRLGVIEEDDLQEEEEDEVRANYSRDLMGFPGFAG